mmetsp:Transcript_39270/g.76677  ORF Transcript_39270/g.76677 Transcript_39270/m.76677 type:complete len:355 (+) Transcript_39270:168-1232(+)
MTRIRSVKKSYYLQIPSQSTLTIPSGVDLQILFQSTLFYLMFWEVPRCHTQTPCPWVAATTCPTSQFVGSEHPLLPDPLLQPPLLLSVLVHLVVEFDAVVVVLLLRVLPHVLPSLLRRAVYFVVVAVLGAQLPLEVLVVVHVLVLDPPFRRFGAAEADVRRGGGAVYGAPRPQGGGVVAGSVQRVDVGSPPDHPFFVLAPPLPLPHVPGDVVEAELVGRVVFDGARAPPAVGGRVVPGEGRPLPVVHVGGRRLVVVSVAPDVEGAGFGPPVSSAGGGLPFLFAGETFAHPRAVFGRVFEGYVHHRVVEAHLVGALWSLRFPPVGPPDGDPELRFWIGVHLLVILLPDPLLVVLR